MKENDKSWERKKRSKLKKLLHSTFWRKNEKYSAACGGKDVGHGLYPFIR
jgi:hypothetical protein